MLLSRLHLRCVLAFDVFVPPAAAVSAPWAVILVQCGVCEVGIMLHECGVYEYVLLCRVFPRSFTLRVVAAYWLRLPAWGIWPTRLVVMYVYSIRCSGLCACDELWYPVSCGRVGSTGLLDMMCRYGEV